MMRACAYANAFLNGHAGRSVGPSAKRDTVDQVAPPRWPWLHGPTTRRRVCRVDGAQCTPDSAWSASRQNACTPERGAWVGVESIPLTCALLGSGRALGDCARVASHSALAANKGPSGVAGSGRHMRFPANRLPGRRQRQIKNCKGNADATFTATHLDTGPKRPVGVVSAERAYQCKFHRGAIVCAHGGVAVELRGIQRLGKVLSSLPDKT